MNVHAQVGNSSLAHLLLVGNRADNELATLLLNDRPWGSFSFLREGFTIDSISIGPCMSNVDQRHVHTVINLPNCPWRCPLQLELSHVTHTEILLLVQGDDSSRFGDIYPDGTLQRIEFGLLTM